MSAPNGRVWKPLDVGGIRLYKVVCQWLRDGSISNTEISIVAARRPMEAAALIRDVYAGTPSEPEIITGHPLNILIPRDWWENGVPCIHDGDRFTAAARALVSEHNIRRRTALVTSPSPEVVAR